MEQRRPPPTGRFWRRRREPVPAITGPPFDVPMWFDDYGGDDDDDWGSAGVREPRRPLPLGPMAGAGEAVPSDPPLAAQLPDPRYS